MRGRRLLATGLLSLAVALACGSGSSEYDYGLRSSKWVGAPQVPLAELHRAFLAPPDRALIGLRVAAKGTSYQGVADAVRAAAAR